jgi:polyribonucleotide nucleotidyltransferase
MDQCRLEIPFDGKTVILETGKFAKQANAAVTVTCGGTVVLATTCMAKTAKPEADFFPLTVEYAEKTYSAGRIPGGFFKREGRPTQKEILSSRLIDRPIRPLFPEGFYNEVVVSATVLSSDGENDPDVLALLAGSAVLTISDIPFNGPIAGARIALVDDQFILNPTYAERNAASLELVVAALEDKIVMVEGEAKEIAEEKIVEAYKMIVEAMQPLRQAQVELREKVGKPKAEVGLLALPADLKKKVFDQAIPKIKEVLNIADKLSRESAANEALGSLIADMSVYADFKVGDREVAETDIKVLFDLAEYEVYREKVFTEKTRADGRGPTDIRPISCEVGLLPRTHGSGLFTRGQTQSLAVVTLGTKRDELLVESLEGVSYEDFMLHYNFPPFSVGEARPSRSPGRREIGHGALAAKALKAVLPAKDDFPYTIRVVSEILESNGSSSMASVCAGSMSLMDAGVPIKRPVAGISIGLISGEGDRESLLITDIMGIEDHHGDMDYKIAGTTDGVTAIQLDIKVNGIPVDVLTRGLQQAKEARMKILQTMGSAIPQPKPDISEFAPRILVTMVPQEKIGEVIGPGGKMIRKIMEETGAESIDIDDDGKVLIAALSKESAQKALDYVNGFASEPEIGKIYDAVVMKVTNFGAFCEFMPGKQGLVHVSELSNTYVKDVTKVVKVGDRFKVKLVEIDKMNRMNLSKKQAEESPAAE